ncbi:MAG: glycosyltransferase family 2 protein [Alphaproteobacteria bacterium]|nr:glycosyltransferase family 2 protein [Alphaproteobacteria bacterium]
MVTITGSVFGRGSLTDAGPKTTVICAVWHGDPDWRQLLVGHRGNLEAQTVPVESIYVFDGGISPPADFDRPYLATGEPLTIYQAWNLALVAVTTPLVMNLNLDDRLCTDAVADFERLMRDPRTGLVGGDWRICYDQATTDDVGPCRPLDTLAVSVKHPARPEDGPVRLGCGAGRETFGPATLWRMALHDSFPPYPMTFGDGTPIRVIGDGVWWSMLEKRGVRLARCNAIVGHYHSHPADQAEFRYDRPGEWEHFQRHGAGPN